jgi:hypothetical protein
VQSRTQEEETTREGLHSLTTPKRREMARKGNMDFFANESTKHYAKQGS